MILKPEKFLPIFAVLLLSAASCLAQSVKTHHVRNEVKNGKAQANGRLPGNQVLQLDLVLPLRDPAGQWRSAGVSEVAVFQGGEPAGLDVLS